MSKSITVWVDKITENLGSPDALKAGLAFWVITFSVSQLAIFFAFLAPQVDSSQTISAAIQQVTGFQGAGILAFGKALVSALALIVIKLKVVSLPAFALLAISMVFIPVLVKDEWLEPVNEIVLVGEIILAAVVIVIAALEVLPFVL